MVSEAVAMLRAEMGRRGRVWGACNSALLKGTRRQARIWHYWGHGAAPETFDGRKREGVGDGGYVVRSASTDEL